MSHFFAYIYRLRFIRRWSLMRNTIPENVAEHSYHVALLTHALCTIACRVFGEEVDTNGAVTLALFHDVGEVITGDIPTPVKHRSAATLQSLRELEGMAGKQLLEMVPEPLRATYRPLIGGEAADSELLRWVKAADRLAAYLKCAAEVAAGNKEFAVAKSQVEKQVRGLRMKEVDYFLEHFAPSFDKTLDEISR
jgi:5'-deoxynucleotidase